MISGMYKTNSGSRYVIFKALFRWIFYTLFGFILLAVDPFGIGSFAEEGSQKVLYEIGGPLYSTDARDDITIVLVTEDSLESLYSRKITGTNEWPLLYQDWSVLLKTITAHNPRSLFVDVYFEQERVTDPSFPALESTLRRFHGQHPIHFAAGMPPYNSPLLQKINSNASLAGSTWEGYGHGVPLEQNGQPIAALKLYRDACDGNDLPLPGCNGDASWSRDPEMTEAALSVVWGSKASLPLTAELEGYRTEEYCSNNTASLSDLALGILKSAAGDLWRFVPFQEDGVGMQCLFHRVIDAEELLLIFDHGDSAEKAALKSALENKIVLLGTFFEGLPDRTESPNMGLVPGVALHAMMLDNLMKYGPDYIRTAGLNTLPYNVAVWAVIVLILVVWIGYREQSVSSKQDGLIQTASAPFTGWDSTIFLAFSLALTCIAAFLTYYFFRFEPANAIGFLGLAELTRRIYGKTAGKEESKE